MYKDYFKGVLTFRLSFSWLEPSGLGVGVVWSEAGSRGSRVYGSMGSVCGW